MDDRYGDQMATVADTAIDIIKEYVAKLEDNGFHIRESIVFGSYINGKPEEWSDIDVALVSDDFEGNRLDDRDRIRRITLDVDYRLDPLPYRPEEFNDEDLFVREILKTGIRIR